MNKYLYVAVILLLPLFLSAQGKKLKKYGIVNPVAPVGIKVGSKAPTFKGIDQNGYLIDSKSMLKNAPVVLIFYRGYWCPYCSKALKTYADSINQVTDKGVWFIAVTPETTEGVAKTIDALYIVAIQSKNLIPVGIATKKVKNANMIFVHSLIPDVNK